MVKNTTKSTTPASLEALLLGHVNAHQKDNASSCDHSAVSQRRAALIRDDLSSFLLSNAVKSLSLDADDDDVGSADPENDKTLSSSLEERITAVFLQCLDSAMATVVSSNTSSSSSSFFNKDEPTDRILDLVALFACTASSSSTLSRALLDRTLQFTTVLLERVRARACTMLGLWANHHRLVVDGRKLQNDGENHDIPKELAFLVSDKNSNDNESTKEMVQSMQEALLARLTDKSQAVRLAAIHASCSLLSTFLSNSNGESTDETTGLLDAVLWNMAHDPSVSNRVAVVQSVVSEVSLPMNSCDASTTTSSSALLLCLPHLLDRVRDVKTKVRVAALEGLQTHMLVTWMVPEQCAEVVRAGLGERCPTTYAAAIKLICVGWLKTFKYDPLALLRHLDPMTYPSECTKVIRVLLDVAHNNNNNNNTVLTSELSDAEIRAFQDGIRDAATLMCSGRNDESLTPEDVLFARVQCDWAKEAATPSSSSSSSKARDTTGMDVVVLCETLEHHMALLGQATNNQDETRYDCESFICTQLLQLAQATDLTEEGSRRHFVATVKGMLVSVETQEELLEPLVGALQVAHEQEVDFLQLIQEVLVRLSDGDDEPSIRVQLRIVSILASVLGNVSAAMASDPVLGDFVRHVVPAVTSSDSSLREIGVGCMGRLALLSRQDMVLDEFKPLLFRVAANDKETMEIRAQAMLAIGDLSLLFADMLQPCSLVWGEDETSVSITFAALISDMLDESEAGVVAVAAEVAAKLLFAGRLHDPSIVAKLLLVFFDQDMEQQRDTLEDVEEVGSPCRMQQLLSLFFPAYSVKSKEGRDTLSVSVGCLLANLEDKLEEKGVRVSHWPVAKMIEYVCSVIDMANAKASATPNYTERADQDEDTSVASMAKKEHASAAISVSIEICKFVLAKNSSLSATYLRVLCRVLGSTHVDPEVQGNVLEEFKKLVGELSMLLTDASSLRAIEKLLGSFASVASEGEESDGDESDGSGGSQESLADALEAIQLAESDQGGKENDSDELLSPVAEVCGPEVASEKAGNGRASRSRSRLVTMNY